MKRKWFSRGKPPPCPSLARLCRATLALAAPFHGLAFLVALASARPWRRGAQLVAARHRVIAGLSGLFISQPTAEKQAATTAPPPRPNSAC